MVEGYKCFNKGLINRYGTSFEIGKIYHTDGEIKYGNKGNGFHFSANLEDTLRYFDTTKEFDICEVVGFGNIHQVNDEYYGYFNLYAAENILIKKLLTREEIINYALNLNELRLCRFLMFFKLTEEEKILFLSKYQNNLMVLDAISYYQDNNKETYKRKLAKL